MRERGRHNRHENDGGAILVSIIFAVLSVGALFIYKLFFPQR